MKLHPAHKEILQEIKDQSGAATKHTFLASYLGNDHPRYAISSPVMRKIAREWAARNSSMPAEDFRNVVTSLMYGKTFTEKCLGGILLDYARPAQRKFDISIFGEWLDQLQGWAEVDALCTGKFSLIELPASFTKWKPFLKKLSKSDKIEKRRASLVFFCSPISHCTDKSIAALALENISALKHEKEILITKAVSWLLRSMIKHYRPEVETYLAANADSLPAIAVRETKLKLKTGKKTAGRKIS